MYSIKRGNRYLLFTMISFILGSILLDVFLLLTKKEMSVTLLVFISQWGMVFIPILLYFLITKSPIKETLMFRKINSLNALMCVGIAWLIIPLLSLVNVISQFFVENMISDAVMQIAEKPLWLSLLLMAATPAFLEEIAMRGIITTNYRSQRVLITCLISGFFFGMFHMNINQFLYAFIMGVVMCFVVHVTGSLFSSMIIHFVINSTSLILAKIVLVTQNYFSSDPYYMNQINQAAAMDETKSLIIGTIVMFVMSLICVPLALLLIRALMKYNNKMDIFKKTTGEVLFPSNDNNVTILQEDNKLINESAPDLYDSINTVKPFVKEKIVTPSFIISVSIFLVFVVLFELILPLIIKPL